MILVNGDFAKKYPDTLAKFLKAQNDSIHDLRNNGDAAMQRMADFLKISIDHAKTEYGGIQLMDAKEQLSDQGLGSGSGIANSRITKAITAAGEEVAGAPEVVRGLLEPGEQVAADIGATHEQPAERWAVEGGRRPVQQPQSRRHPT